MDITQSNTSTFNRKDDKRQRLTSRTNKIVCPVENGNVHKTNLRNSSYCKPEFVSQDSKADFFWEQTSLNGLGTNLYF